MGTGEFIAGATLRWTSIFGLVFFDILIVIHTGTSTYTIYNSNTTLTAKVNYITDKMLLYNSLTYALLTLFTIKCNYRCYLQETICVTYSAKQYNTYLTYLSRHFLVRLVFSPLSVIRKKISLQLFLFATTLFFIKQSQLKLCKSDIEWKKDLLLMFLVLVWFGVFCFFVSFFHFLTF